MFCFISSCCFIWDKWNYHTWAVTLLLHLQKGELSCLHTDCVFGLCSWRTQLQLCIYANKQIIAANKYWQLAAATFKIQFLKMGRFLERESWTQCSLRGLWTPNQVLVQIQFSAAWYQDGQNSAGRSAAELWCLWSTSVLLRGEGMTGKQM